MYEVILFFVPIITFNFGIDILVPYFLYQFYQDSSTMSTYYTKMKSYLDYLTSQANNSIINYGLGDWCDILI